MAYSEGDLQCSVFFLTGAVLACALERRAEREGAPLGCDAHEGESPGSGGRHAEAWHRLL